MHWRCECAWISGCWEVGKIKFIVCQQYFRHSYSILFGMNFISFPFLFSFSIQTKWIGSKFDEIVNFLHQNCIRLFRYSTNGGKKSYFNATFSNMVISCLYVVFFPPFSRKSNESTQFKEEKKFVRSFFLRIPESFAFWLAYSLIYKCVCLFFFLNYFQLDVCVYVCVCVYWFEFLTCFTVARIARTTVAGTRWRWITWTWTRWQMSGRWYNCIQFASSCIFNCSNWEWKWKSNEHWA